MLCFSGKTAPYGKILKILFRNFIATPIDVLCSNVVEFGRREISEIGEIVRYLPDTNNNFFWLPSCRY